MTARRSDILVFVLTVILTSVSAKAGIDLKQNNFDESELRLKYQFSSGVNGELSYTDVVAASTEAEDFGENGVKRKSPLKAFLLSMAVPGLGQYYYGSKIKPFAFLGTEVAAWAFYFKFRGDANDAEDAYEMFNHAHWSRNSYEQKYLATVYDGRTDDDLIHEHEISHHLPNEETQQYFEMAGKYDQFSWGWDDATWHGQTLDELILRDSLERITGPVFTPVSSNRQIYENMRHDSNQKFQRSRNMIILSMINRLVSSFDAYIATKRQNDRLGSGESFLSAVKVRPSIKSMHESFDTPYVKLSYKF